MFKLVHDAFTNFYVNGWVFSGGYEQYPLWITTF